MAKWQGMDPIKWASKTKDAPRDAINAFAFKLFEGVVDKTPVDTGACRQNWLVTVNSQTDNFDPEKTTGQVLIEGAGAIEKAVGDDKIFIQNNAPYVNRLEYGGYGTKKPKKVTAAGFSKQAPKGMVGVTLAKADQLFQAAVNAVKENP